jgi:type I restriction enzyme S subunit
MAILTMNNYQLSIKNYQFYKDSGVEWIGEIPEHWEVKHLKNIVSVKITDGPHETPVFTDDGIPFISAEAIQNGGVNFDSKRGYISKETDGIYSLKCKPRKNDIFIVKSGSTTGKIGYVSTDINFNIWSPLALVRANKVNYSRHLFYFLSSSFFQRQVQMYWSLGTQPNIGMKVLENLQVVIPPLPEHKAIAHYLDTKTAHIDQIIQTINTQIEKLKELRKTLINDVVTGKIKVIDNGELKMDNY